MNTGKGWQESFLNEEGKHEDGSREKELQFFSRLGADIKKEVMHFAAANKRPMRGNHAGIIAGFTQARFVIASELPGFLQAGFLVPGNEYAAIVRFSNASGEVTGNHAKPDLRGVAVRVKAESGPHDFLMTNAEPHHARDAREAMVTIMSSVEKDIVADLIPGELPLEDAIAGLTGALPFLVKHLGLKAGWRIAQTLKKQMGRAVESAATETYWSRAPLAIGTGSDAVAVKYRLLPAVSKTEKPKKEKDLRRELGQRLISAGLHFLFQVQLFDNNEDTPIEDSTIAWQSPFMTIAELIIPQNSPIENELVDELAFNPWNLDAAYFQPLGSMNRSRKIVYPASASLGGRPSSTAQP